jgi:hypothetical protein
VNAAVVAVATAPLIVALRVVNAVAWFVRRCTT